jgi:hypothetical protein
MVPQHVRIYLRRADVAALGAVVGFPRIHATCLDDLKVPPGNKLHQLSGDRKGQYAIAANDQWRICFSFRDGDAFDVEFCDYH